MSSATKEYEHRWCAQWGYADSQGFGVATSLGLIEFVEWSEADRAIPGMVDRFAKQEQADHDAINRTMVGVTPEAVNLLERHTSQARPRGQEWACKVESVTGHQYMFVIEYDGPDE